MRPNLYILPIEPLEERYTGEWYRLLPEKFAEWNFETVTQIDGTPTTSVIETGSFLDINSTIHYKAGQMQKVSEMFRQKQVKEGDVFFVSDLEFWGIESLRLMSQINQVPIKIYGFLHAASYTREDAFEVAASYQKFTEVGWIAAVDGVFVGTHYHREAVIDRRLKPLNLPDAEFYQLSNKFHVVGNPLFLDAYHTNVGATAEVLQKENKIVITNRFDSEKRPDQSLLIAYLVKQQLPDTKVVITTSRPTFRSNQQWLVDLARSYEKEGWLEIKSGLSKQEYHNELKTAKVMISNSIEENFGYCIVEAILFGVSPILTNGLSHPELVNYNGRYLFDNISEAVEKTIAQLKDHDPPSSSHLYKYVKAPGEMAKKMLGFVEQTGPAFPQGCYT